MGFFSGMGGGTAKSTHVKHCTGSGGVPPPRKITALRSNLVGFWQLADCSQVPITCVQNHFMLTLVN